MLAAGEIHPRVAVRISFDGVADTHRRLAAGGLEGKIVLRPTAGWRAEGSIPSGA